MKNGIVYASLVVLLIVLCLGVGVLGYFTQGFRSWDFGIKETVNKDSKGSIAAVAPEIYDSDTIGLAYAASASSTATITAMVLPETAANRNVTWSIAWANADSSFASGKDVSDYIALSSNGNVATVECLQAFGEKINVIATSESSPTISATCVLNYVRRIESVAYYVYSFKSTEEDPGSDSNKMFSEVTSGGHYAFNAYTYSTVEKDFNDTDNYKNTSLVNKFAVYEITYGTGTVNDNFDVSFTYTFNSDLEAELKQYYTSKGASGDGLSVNAKGMPVRLDNLISGNGSVGGYLTALWIMSYSDTVSDVIGIVSKYDTIWTVTATFTGQYSTFTDTVYAGYNPSSLVIPAASVSMSSNEVFF